jgi:hypothetical protein
MASSSFNSLGYRPSNEIPVVDNGPSLDRYAPTQPISKGDEGHVYGLEVIQDPVRARMCGHGDKDRRPIGPPPVVRLVKKSKETKQEVDYE